MSNVSFLNKPTSSGKSSGSHPIIPASRSNVTFGCWQNHPSEEGLDISLHFPIVRFLRGWRFSLSLSLLFCFQLPAWPRQQAPRDPATSKLTKNTSRCWVYLLNLMFLCGVNKQICWFLIQDIIEFLAGNSPTQNIA